MARVGWIGATGGRVVRWLRLKGGWAAVERWRFVDWLGGWVAGWLAVVARAGCGDWVRLATDCKKLDRRFFIDDSFYVARRGLCRYVQHIEQNLCQ